MQNRIYNLIVLIVVSLLFISGCKKKDDVEKTVLSVKGSDTMVNLSQKWAEVYMQKFSDVSIQVTGGGSGTGVAALLNGTTDLANSSRELKESEFEKAAELGITPNVIEVALDGLAVIVHPENGIESLTLKQVSDLFSGKVNKLEKAWW